MSLNSTTHVAVTRGGKTISFYIDGQPAGQSGPPTCNPSATDRRPSAWARATQARASPQWLSLSEVKIWSIERRPELLLTRDLPLSGREAGLAAYYRLDEDGGSTAFDQTTSGHHGQMIAGTPLMVGAAVYLVRNPGGDLLLYHHVAGGRAGTSAGAHWHRLGRLCPHPVGA